MVNFVLLVLLLLFLLLLSALFLTVREAMVRFVLYFGHRGYSGVPCVSQRARRMELPKSLRWKCLSEAAESEFPDCVRRPRRAIFAPNRDRLTGHPGRDVSR